MKFHAVGQPLELLETKIMPPKDAEILVRVRCCTLCRSDLHTYEGRRTEPTPNILGHEIIGTIEAFGPAATTHDGSGNLAQVGDRITWSVAVGCGSCFFCLSADLPQKCTSLFKYGHRIAGDPRPAAGGLADMILLLPGTFWLKVPESIPDVVAASANCATATAAAIIRAAGSLTNRKVLVLGAGVLGLTVCAMARAAGAKIVIASDPIPQCRERASAFGATHTETADTTELKQTLSQLTENRGADVVIESAGSLVTTRTALELVRVGGTIILAGTVSPVGKIELDPEQIVRRMLTIRGVHNYHPRDLSYALEFLANAGQQYPWASLVVREYPLQDAEQAFAAAHQRPGERIAIRPECAVSH